MFKRLACCLLVFVLACSSSVAPLSAFEPSTDDLALLNQIEKDTLQYFVRLSDKTTGLTRDSSRPGSPSSVAATGFALAAYAIGSSRGWISQDYAYGRILTTLKTLRHKAAHENGFFYHFLDLRTGKRVWGSEASSIDTALAVAGALLAAAYYPGTEVETLAYEIYERVNWKWMMNGSDFICMGWTPEAKFLPYYWDSYNELMILVALAIGSPTFPVPPQAWERWLRPEGDYNGHKMVYASTGSLFTYQFSHAYIDFRKLDDRGINFFENSREATLANREYSMSFSGQYKGYSESSWGLSASVGPGGYKAYGGKPGGGIQDGTIAPYAALSSIVFTPELSIKAARFFYENYQKELYGNFGFKDAFHLDKQWWAEEYLGIDQGITLLMLENFLNGEILWKKFMELPAIKKWIELTGLEQRSSSAAKI
ncbi:MAG: glucoamylase family protein [Candidatus Omnitrophota bacterium]